MYISSIWNFLQCVDPRCVLWKLVASRQCYCNGKWRSFWPTQYILEEEEEEEEICFCHNNSTIKYNCKNNIHGRMPEKAHAHRGHVKVKGKSTCDVQTQKNVQKNKHKIQSVCKYIRATRIQHIINIISHIPLKSNNTCSPLGSSIVSAFAFFS